MQRHVLRRVVFQRVTGGEIVANETVKYHFVWRACLGDTQAKKVGGVCRQVGWNHGNFIVLMSRSDL